MRLHVVSMPHTQTTRAYSHCAYTQKVLKFCDMMTDGGYKVVLYSGEENDARCEEHVTIVSEAERKAWFGTEVNEKLPTITWDPYKDPWWKTFNERVIGAIGTRRCGPCKDTLCLIAGLAQKPVAEAYPDMLPVEFGVGYEGVFADLRVYESYAWMHYLYGKYGQKDGRFFDTVIPNYFDRQDFFTGVKEDYVLYVGRLIKRKGPDIAAEIARRAGMQLIVAGAGATHVSEGLIQSPEVRIEGNVIHAGVVGPEDRATLMAGARALIAPTLYIGPFEGVTVEAMLSGTPALTTDWGVFPETVETGVTGYRFRTLGEADDMLDMCFDLDPESIRERALERYSLEAVFPMYDKFFNRVDKLRRTGWYE